MIVLTFRPRFESLVARGLKRQTFRVRKTYPQPGDILSLRAWSGRPYASKQLILLPAEKCRILLPCTIAPGAIVLDGCSLGSVEAERFARADGFADLAGLFAFMAAEHRLGTPKVPALHGGVIYW